MRKINAVLLGLDNPHSIAHLKTLDQLPEVDRVQVWAESDEFIPGVEEAGSPKVERVSTDLSSILAAGAHLAVASPRTDRSPDVCIQALEAGHHVLAEKPIGSTVPEIGRVVQSARDHGRKLGVFYGRRYHPLVRQVRDIIAQGLLGTLMSMELRMLTTQVRFRDPGYWLFKKRISGGGMLSWLGCHYVDKIRFITGEEIVSVSAEVATRSGEDIDVEDVAVLSFRLASGTVGTLHVGFVMALSGGGYHNVGGYDTYVGVNGRRGRLYFSSAGTPDRLKVETDHPDWSDAPWREFEYTLSASPAYGGVHWRAIRPGLSEGDLGRGDRPGLGRRRPAGGAHRGSGLRVQRNRTPGPGAGRLTLSPEALLMVGRSENRSEDPGDVHP